MNATATLVVPDAISSLIGEALLESRETAGVLLVSEVAAPDRDLQLLARELHLVPNGGYIERTATELTISSDGYVPALGRAAEIGASALWFHTHPGEGASPGPSHRDQIVDQQLAELFRIRSGLDSYGALICAPSGGRFGFTGSLENAAGHSIIRYVWEVGRRFRLTAATNAPLLVDNAKLFDRNIRAFGGAIQGILGALTVTIVGCGGTGSAVAEQLVRLGVRDLTLIDPDVLSDSNVTRVYGSTPHTIGEPKAEVLRDWLVQIAPDAHIRSVLGSVVDEGVARRLIGSNVIFGCTDDNAGRLVLSRFSSYMLTPLIDCGVVLTSGPKGCMAGIDGRVTTLVPGAACLVCRDRIDLQRAHAESLSAEEHELRQREDYAAALPGVEPAVVPYTTGVAAAAVGELLERLVGYGDEPAPTELLIRFHDREISTNLALPRDGHYCDPTAGKIGFGAATPFLEQAWLG
jgi:molybdopterin/thiamine biosynthesis adenylyltransferase